MKKLIFCLAVLGAVLSGCSTDDDNENGGDNGGNGGSQTPQLPELPPLPDPNDVCSCMDDIVFMQYCYDNFDVNHDGKVSPTEAAAVPEMILGAENDALPVKSLTGIGYFTNLELLYCRGCSQLQSVDLRRNRKLKLPRLGDNESPKGCFSKCSALSEIFLPDNISSIGDLTFAGCSSLTSITIPDSVTEIGAAAFSRCTNLSRFYGKYATSDNRCLVVDGKLVGFAPCDLESYTIPNNVTKIEDRAFYNCNSLTSITIPDSVTTIGYDAFYRCSSLTSFYCKPQTPPTIDSDGIGLNEDVVIYVPTESVDAYKTAEYWSEYAAQIQGYDF